MPETNSTGADFNSRTSEPRIREVTTSLDNLKELLEAKVHTLAMKLEEMDKRYTQRFHAQEEHYSQAFKSSQVAIDKAETAQKDKNQMMNEFRGQLTDQAATFMPRKEVEVMVNATQATVANVREEMRREVLNLQTYHSNQSGRRDQSAEDKGALNRSIIMGLTIAGLLISMVMLVIKLVGH